ncbi:MAG TPA: ComEA family DNA-binding protein [Actinomycetota bacterium]
MDGIREWLSGLGRREAVVVAVAGVVLAGAAAVWYVRSMPAPAPEVRREQAPVPGPSASPATLVVHVAGWVRRPGVYRLPEGARVIDAVDLAGGARRGADLSALNLAAVLADAQQILVPKRGASAGPGGSGHEQALVNLNTATVEELETLPGIGEVLAQRIFDHRQEHGPFRTVEDLLDVSGIGDQRLADLRDKVTV